MDSELTPASKVPFWRTLLYSLANAASLLIYWTFNNFIQFFYIDVQGLPPHWIGRGWFAFSLWNAVNDPIAGWISDRTSTRWGRRRFYIGILAIPTAIAFAFVWLPPVEASPNALMVYFLVIISIYDMLQSIITLNQDALFPEMYEDTRARVEGASARQIIGVVFGNGVAVALTPAIYGTYGWTALAVLWGTIAAVMYLVSLIGIKENPAFAQQQETASWQKQVRTVFNNRTFIIVLGLNFTIRFIVAAIGAIMPFYAEYVLQIEESRLTVLLMALFLTAGVSILAWQAIIRRIGTRRAVLISMSMAAVFATPLLFTASALSTGIVLALLGAAVGGLLLGPDMLFAEVVDEDFVHTGQRREGMYRGILGFFFRFPPGVAGLILGESLQLAGYDADLAVNAQPDAVITIIRVFTSLLPLVALVIGIALILIYPLHGAYLEDIQLKASTLRRKFVDDFEHDMQHAP